MVQVAVTCLATAQFAVEAGFCIGLDGCVIGLLGGTCSRAGCSEIFKLEMFKVRLGCALTSNRDRFQNE